MNRNIDIIRIAQMLHLAIRYLIIIYESSLMHMRGNGVSHIRR